MELRSLPYSFQSCMLFHTEQRLDMLIWQGQHQGISFSSCRPMQWLACLSKKIIIPDLTWPLALQHLNPRLTTQRTLGYQLIKGFRKLQAKTLFVLAKTEVMVYSEDHQQGP